MYDILMKSYYKIVKNLHSQPNSKEKFAYFVIVIISLYRLYTETASADLYIFTLLLDKDLSIVIYAQMILIFLFLIHRFKQTLSNIEYRQIATYIAIFLVMISALFFFLGTYPPIDSGVDHDEATEAWNDALLEGEYPYDPEVHSEYDVRRLTVLPSIPLLALPLYITADVAILTVFGVLLISAVFRREAHTERKYAMSLIALLFTVPLSFRVLTHSNYVHLVALFVVGFHFLRNKNPVVAGVIFGILFTAKTNTWPLLPVVGIAILDKWTLQRSTSFFLMASITGGIVLTPFILWDPGVFFNIAPLGVATDHQNTFGLTTTIFAAIVVLLSVTSYAYRRNLIEGVIVGSFILLLGYPGRYQLFLSVFVVMWAFLTTNLISSDSDPDRETGKFNLS